jgi:hypothetical protein
MAGNGRLIRTHALRTTRVDFHKNSGRPNKSVRSLEEQTHDEAEAEAKTQEQPTDVPHGLTELEK